MQSFLDDLEAFFTGKAWTIVWFFAVLLFGIITIRIACRLIRKTLFRTSKNKTLCGFLLSIIRFILYLILMFILASIAGISVTPLITALGAASLAIGLALQDSISNIANGVLIVSTKPFKVGDLIEINGEMGVVKAIRMITVELLTADNRKIILPNSKVIQNSVVNYSARPTRRVEISVPVHFDSDARKVKQILLDELNKCEFIMENPAPYVILTSFKNHLEFSARGWVNTQDYWTTLWHLTETIHLSLTDNGIEIPHGHTTLEFKNSPSTQSLNRLRHLSDNNNNTFTDKDPSFADKTNKDLTPSNSTKNLADSDKKGGR